ncbi:hypothetical protein GF340_04625 [Candidatus Peregrinibacteria bacterium]|nr:hypothetical protein [Candidatus Peregrinibacteria bacterium]
MAKTNETPKYTGWDLMIISAARLIEDNMVIYAGCLDSFAAAMMAKKMHAPRAKILYDGGIIDSDPKELALGMNDPRLLYKSSGNMDTRTVLTQILQGGYVEAGFISGNQIDRYGNVNATMFGKYKKPKARFENAGSVNDIASLAQTTVIMAELNEKTFTKCDFITAPGHLTGGNSREKADIVGGGPVFIVTDMAIFDFHVKNKKARLVSIHPGYTKKEVFARMQWKPLSKRKVPFTVAPDKKEIEALNSLFL